MCPPPKAHFHMCHTIISKSLDPVVGTHDHLPNIFEKIRHLGADKVQILEKRGVPNG